MGIRAKIEEVISKIQDKQPFPKDTEYNLASSYHAVSGESFFSNDLFKRLLDEVSNIISYYADEVAPAVFYYEKYKDDDYIDGLRVLSNEDRPSESEKEVRSYDIYHDYSIQKYYNLTKKTQDNYIYSQKALSTFLSEKGLTLSKNPYYELFASNSEVSVFLQELINILDNIDGSFRYADTSINITPLLSIHTELVGYHLSARKEGYAKQSDDTYLDNSSEDTHSSHSYLHYYAYAHWTEDSGGYHSNIRSDDGTYTYVYDDYDTYIQPPILSADSANAESYADSTDNFNPQNTSDHQNYSTTEIAHSYRTYKTKSEEILSHLSQTKEDYTEAELETTVGYHIVRCRGHVLIENAHIYKTSEPILLRFYKKTTMYDRKYNVPEMVYSGPPDDLSGRCIAKNGYEYGYRTSYSYELLKTVTLVPGDISSGSEDGYYPTVFISLISEDFTITPIHLTADCSNLLCRYDYYKASDGKKETESSAYESFVSTEWKIVATLVLPNETCYPLLREGDPTD